MCALETKLSLNLVKVPDVEKYPLKASGHYCCRRAGVHSPACLYQAGAERLKKAKLIILSTSALGTGSRKRVTHKSGTRNKEMFAHTWQS